MKLNYQVAPNFTCHQLPIIIGETGNIGDIIYIGETYNIGEIGETGEIYIGEIGEIGEIIKLILTHNRIDKSFSFNYNFK